MDISSIVTFIVCIIVLFIIGKIFIWPLKKILKLVLNSCLGGALIYFINIIGMSFDFHIGLNLITAATVGILGVPGVVLLIILRLLFG